MWERSWNRKLVKYLVTGYYGKIGPNVMCACEVWSFMLCHVFEETIFGALMGCCKFQLFQWNQFSNLRYFTPALIHTSIFDYNEFNELSYLIFLKAKGLPLPLQFPKIFLFEINLRLQRLKLQIHCYRITSDLNVTRYAFLQRICFSMEKKLFSVHNSL